MLLGVFGHVYSRRNSKNLTANASWCYGTCTDNTGKGPTCRLSGCDYNSGYDCVPCGNLSTLPDCTYSPNCNI